MDQTPTHLDLFSGIGGFALAAQRAGFRTIGFCEIDKYCQKVLAKNFLADSNGGQCFESQGEIQARRDATNGSDPRIHPDIFDLDGRDFAGVSLITGGFPCQPFSVAGKRRGAADDRAIWPEMFRVINEARPAWVLGENVPGIIPMELDNVLSGLEGIGYACRSFVIPACAVDARHRRDRLWVVGRLVADVPRVQQGREIERTDRERVGACSESISDTNEPGSQGRNGKELRECASERVTGACDSPISDSNERRLSGRSEQNGRRGEVGWIECECRWLPEPDVGRVAHGIPSRVDRLKGLGNAIVPQVAYQILKLIRDEMNCQL